MVQGKRRMSSRSHTIGTALAIFSACSVVADSVSFDLDTGTPALSPYQSLPVGQAAGGITAQFSAVTGGFSIQTDATTQLTLPQFSGNYVYPNYSHGNVLRMQFSQRLTGISFTFATTDHPLSAPTPTPIILTAFAGTTVVGSATNRATYASYSFPMGTLTFSFRSNLFNRVEVKIQGSGDTTFFVDNVSVTTVPELNIDLAGPNTVAVSWPWPSTGFVLQHNSALGTTNWVDVTNAVEIVNGENQVMLAADAANAFFRLVHR